MALSARAWGATVAVLGLLLDQAVKLYLLGPFALAEKGRVAVAPFLDLVLVWNRGVSYGLLQQDSEAGRWLLIAIAVAGSGLFAWWLWRAERRLAAVALGLIIGGALSNVIDRVAYGAVADFFLVHVGGFEWYVFNVADAFIVAGVVGLVLAWGLERPEKATES